MQFIGRGETRFWIAKLPPELMAYDIDVEGRRRHLLILDGKKNACRGEEKNQHDQDGDHRPGQLNLGAAVDLGRFAVIVGIALPVADHDVHQKRGDHDKNRPRYLNHKKRQMVNHQRRAGVGIEGARRLVDDVVGGRCPGRSRRSSAAAATHTRLVRALCAAAILGTLSRILLRSKKTHCSALRRQTV